MQCAAALAGLTKDQMVETVGLTSRWATAPARPRDAAGAGCGCVIRGGVAKMLMMRRPKGAHPIRREREAGQRQGMWGSRMWTVRWLGCALESRVLLNHQNSI